MKFVWTLIILGLVYASTWNPFTGDAFWFGQCIYSVIAISAIIYFLREHVVIASLCALCEVAAIFVNAPMVSISPYSVILDVHYGNIMTGLYISQLILIAVGAYRHGSRVESVGDIRSYSVHGVKANT